MKLSLKEKGENYLEIVMEDVDYSIGDIIRYELLKEVPFAAIYESHPLIRSLYLRLEGPKEALLRAIDRALELVKSTLALAEGEIK